MDPNANSVVQMAEMSNDVIHCESDVNIAASADVAFQVPSNYDDIVDSGDEHDDSAPIELLTALLTSVTAKNYDEALVQCNEILAFEPANETAKRFHLLITERLKLIAEEGASDEAGNSSDEDTESGSSSSSGSSESDGDGADTSDEEDGGNDFDDDDLTLSSYASSYDGASENEASGNEASGNGSSAEDGPEVCFATAEVESPAFQTTSSDAMLATEQNSNELIGELRAKVVPSKLDEKKE